MGESENGRKKMRSLRSVGIAIAALLGIPIAALAVVIAFGITFSLGAFRADIEEAAGAALGRAVEIEGPLTLLPALRPMVEVQGLRIGNSPESDAEDFLRLELARVTVNLLPLIRREISIEQIAVEGVDVRLESKANGKNNWVFEPEPSKATKAAADRPGFEFVRLGELAIRSLSIDYRDEGSSETFTVEVEAVEASAGRDDPTVLSARGLAQEQPFSISATGGSLAALSDSTRPWPVDISAKVAGAVASLSGTITEPLGARGVDVGIAISGDQLEALESLTELTLPQSGPYEVKARLVRSEMDARLTGIECTIGNTTFGGEIVLDLNASPPRVSGTLDIATLDLEPFLTDNSRTSNASTGSAEEALEHKGQVEWMGMSLDEITISFEALHGVDADLALTVDRVMGAPVDIRAVSLRATVDDGQLTVPIAVTVSDVPIEGQLAI